MRKFKHTFTSQVTLHNGKEVEGQFEITFCHVNNAGADADNRRGYPETWILDAQVLSAITKDIYGHKLNDTEQAEAQRMLFSAALNNQPYVIDESEIYFSE